VRRQLVIDGRNCLDPDALVEAGFTYMSVGRPTRHPISKASGRHGRSEAPALIRTTASRSKRIA